MITAHSGLIGPVTMPANTASATINPSAGSSANAPSDSPASVSAPTSVARVGRWWAMAPFPSAPAMPPPA
jgi:hypothetical protein